MHLMRVHPEVEPKRIQAAQGEVLQSEVPPAETESHPPPERVVEPRKTPKPRVEIQGPPTTQGFFQILEVVNLSEKLKDSVRITCGLSHPWYYPRNFRGDHGGGGLGNS